MNMNNFIRKTITIISCICFLQHLSAQTTLSAGDIAIIGGNRLSPSTTFELAIVTLVDISSGTTIYISDFGWSNSTSSFVTTSNLTAEGCITWTTNSAIAKGTVFLIKISGATTPVITGLPGSISTIGWTTNSVSIPVSAAGDNWFIFQGTGPTAPSTFVYGFTNFSLTTISTLPAGSANGWLNSEQQTSGSVTTSELPTSLTNGSTARSLAWVTGAGGTHGDCFVYSGTTTGNKSAILTAIGNLSNWTSNEISGYYLTSSSSYSGGLTLSGNPYFTNFSVAGAPTTWNGSTWSNGTPTSATDVVIASNTAPGSFTCNALTVNSGITLNVSNGSTVTVSSSTTNNGNIVVAPTGNFVSAAAVSNVTIQKSIIGQRGWRMFAYPFTTTQTFSSLASTNGIAISTTPSGASGLTDVRSFTNGTTNGWNNVTASSTTANTPFALFIRGLSSEVIGLNYSAGPSAFTFSVNGTLNASPFTVTPSASNFTLVGNPFAAPVNSSALTNGTGKSYYVYQISQGGNLTAQRTKAGAWSTVLSSSATTPIPTLGIIAYQAGSASSYTVSTSDINTSNAATTGLFSTEKVIEHLELRVLQNGMQLDNLFVRQDAAATAAGTDGKDLQKLANEGLNVYTIAKEDNTKLAVDARNLVETTTIPLGVVGAVGNYQLQVANLNIEGVNVSLKDAFTGTTTTLKANSNYKFAITSDAASKGENRFELVLNKVANNIAGIDVTNAGKMTAKLLNGNINRNNVAQLEITGAAGKVEIRVTDMAGRLLHTQAGQNGRNTIQLGRKAGVQLITISDGITTINQKMVKQ